MLRLTFPQNLWDDVRLERRFFSISLYECMFTAGFNKITSSQTLAFRSKAHVQIFKTLIENR